MAKKDAPTKQDIEELAVMTERAIRTEVSMLHEEIAKVRNKMVTKEEAKQFTTKHDLQDLKGEIFEYIDGTIEKFQSMLLAAIKPLQRTGENHETRITHLEERVK